MAALLDKLAGQVIHNNQVRAHEPGIVEQWHIQEGAHVERYTPLCETEFSAYSAPIPGIVRIIATAGSWVETGDILATIETPSSAPTKPKRRIMAECGEPTSPRPTPPSSIPSSIATQPASLQSTEISNPKVIVEELKLTPQQVAPPRTNKRKEKKRTKNRTYSIGLHQERALARLAAELKLDDTAPNVNESELVRVAIEMLLELPQPALLTMIRANKQHEAKEKFGTGRPRPGKSERTL